MWTVEPHGCNENENERKIVEAKLAQARELKPKKIEGREQNHTLALRP